nr:extracellular ribonuclease LE-like [Ipomoea batatas]
MALIRSQISVFINFLFIIHSFLIFYLAQGYDFFYFVQQWPGSYCDTKDSSCCYPTTGKPASDFGIHGLWPNNNDGTYPSNCDSSNPYDESKISDLMSKMQQDWPSLACPSNNGSSFWSHEWEKHGTCSESELDQHTYFETALNLKNQTYLLQILESAGIQADGNSYNLSSIQTAIENAGGYAPGIECNSDAGGNSQLYQVYFCVGPSGSNLIKCPVFPTGSCASSIKLPSF